MKNAKEILASSLVLKAWEIIKSNLFAFIEEFVYIENMDTGQPVLFKLWPEQKRALQKIHDNRLTIVLKARQLGLTWLALAYALWCMLTRTGFRVTALSKKEDDALELVRRVKFILRNIPSYLIIEGKTEGILSWEGTTGRVTIHHPDGEDSVLQSFTAAADSGRSFTSSLVLIDEWAFQEYAEQIWTAAYPTVNRPGGGKVIGLSTGKRGSFFETMWNNAVSKANNFMPIFLNWRADPSRDDKWYEQTKKDLPNSHRQEYPNTPEDAFAIGQGAFFPEWKPEAHVIQDPLWYPPDECQIRGAYDPGFTRACFKWYAVFQSGRAVCYREYYPSQVTDDIQAKKIKELSVRPDGTPEYLAEIRADPDAWKKQRGTGRSTAQVFAEHGIYMIKADNDLKNGWRRLHQYLMPFQDKDGKLISVLSFTTNCANTIRTYPACEQDKNNPEDISKNSEHHCFVKGTMITTIDGNKPIETIKSGDIVLTREGYKKVIASGATTKTKVYRAIFSNGKSLIGTYNHPIATKDGRWVAMGDLSLNDNIITLDGLWEKKLLSIKKSNLQDMSIPKDVVTEHISGLHQHGSGRESGIFIKRFGKTITAISRKVITYITKTITHLIIQLKTLNASRDMTTCQCTRKLTRRAKHIWGKCGKRRQNGINQKTGVNGMSSKAKKIWTTENQLSEGAHSVEKKKKQNHIKAETGFVATNVSQRGEENKALIMKQGYVSYAGQNSNAINIVSRKPVLSNAVHVVDLWPVGIDTVYNLTVDGCPEYFANGILVHNCQDVDRYFCMHMPATIDYDAILVGGFPSRYSSPLYDDFDDDDESEPQTTFYGY